MTRFFFYFKSRTQSQILRIGIELQSVDETDPIHDWDVKVHLYRWSDNTL